MDTVALIKTLCKEKGIPISKLEKDCGFSNGYIRGLRRGVLPNDRAQIIADYLGVSITFLTTGKKPTVDYIVKTDDGTEVLVETYYLNEETRAIAQEIFENKELRMLFDVSRNASAERLMAYYNLIKAMQDTEKGND